MSNKQIRDFIKTDMLEFASRPGGKGFSSKTCVQTAGDVFFIPQSWGHGILNLQESVAVAIESLPPYAPIISSLVLQSS